jgi:hypothetical protein
VQPLDKYVNAIFKSALKSIGKKPKKRAMKDLFLPFITQIEQAIHYALQPAAIIRSFKVTGIVPFNPDLILSELPETCPSYAVPEQTRAIHRIQISGTILTSSEMLQQLKDNDKQREEREKKGKKKPEADYRRGVGCDSDSVPSSGNEDEEDDRQKEMQEIEKENTWLASSLKPVVVFDDETDFDSQEDTEESTDEEMADEGGEMGVRVSHAMESEEGINRKRKRLKCSASEAGRESSDTEWLDS